jgi:two-component system response regulator YesN
VLESYDLTVAGIKKLVREACELRGFVRNSRHSEVVDKVLRYVEEHYKDEELSLNQVADYVSFSANHLSTVFHQEYGQSFVKYLTDFRMNKAKKLLRETGMRSSDVCYEVGYKDPHYFSSIFKKTQGITPTQYREGKGL